MLATRELAVGTKLQATYKKTVYTCEVVGLLEGNTTPQGNRYRLEDGREFKSLSSAGKAVMNGMACNGWRFWSRAGEAVTETAEEVAPAHGAKAKPTTKTVRQISKIPNQKGVPEGQTKWFCSACQTSFLVDGKDAPDACPEGHTREVVDELAPLS
jgi:hypothetical protein